MTVTGLTHPFLNISFGKPSIRPNFTDIQGFNFLQPSRPCFMAIIEFLVKGFDIDQRGAIQHIRLCDKKHIILNAGQPDGGYAQGIWVSRVHAWQKCRAPGYP